MWCKKVGISTNDNDRQSIVDRTTHLTSHHQLDQEGRNVKSNEVRWDPKEREEITSNSDEGAPKLESINIWVW